LLTCQGPVIKDASANNFTVTINNNPSYNNLSPFRPFLKENVIESGSINFTSSAADSIPLPLSSKFAINPNQDFTMECWVYLTSLRSNYAFIMYFYDGPSILQFRIGNAGFGYRVQACFGASASGSSIYENASYTQNNLLNTWTHLALCRNGTTTTFYFNGVNISSQTGVGGVNIATPGEAYLSYPSPYSFVGNVSNVRLVTGTALYTGNFTPKGSLQSVPNAQLLLKSASSSLWLKDDSINNFTLTPLVSTTYSSLTPETSNPILNYKLDADGITLTELDEVSIGTGDNTAQKILTDGTLMVKEFVEI
jgi:hypothetical protein